MPIYEYQCGACGHVFEALQKMSDDPLRDCPKCNAPELKKALSAPRFRLKGKGWYETDFKTGEKKKNLHDVESKGDKKAADSKDTKTDKSDSTKDKASPKKDTKSTGSSASDSK
ncbi:MAG: zinc ribbon domain-containing protein [Pseudomonadota bacterium]